MTDLFINTKNRDKVLINAFFNYLENFDNEEKCEIISKTAKALMQSGSKQDIFCAELIMVHATQHYMSECNTDAKAKVYYLLGQLYELHIESFIKTYTYYKKYALNNTVNEGTHSILLRALILRDNFKYSEELENELLLSLSEYDLGERNDRLYKSLGMLIVAKHKNDTERTDELTKRLKNIVKGDELFFLDFVLTKEKSPVRLKVPQKVIDYIAAL